MPVSISKAVVTAEIADYIIETFKPDERPAVIMWRELMNGYRAKHGDTRFLLRQDGPSTHEDFKRFGPAVIAILRKRYRLTVVTVGKNIRDRVNHGHPPDRGEGDKRELDDKKYRECLAGRCNPTMGFVVFPRDGYQDHPLIEGSLNRNVKAGSSHIANAVNSVHTACDLGTLSAEVKDKILGTAVNTARLIIEGPMPLFSKALPESPRAD